VILWLLAGGIWLVLSSVCAIGIGRWLRRMDEATRVIQIDERVKDQ